MCKNLLGKFTEKHHDQLYGVMRILVGFLFLQHGGQKLFGWFGGIGGDGAAVALFSLMGLAGVIEFFGGLAIAVGFFTRLAALGSALEMVGAYLIAHLPKGLNPFIFGGNGGELALMYFAAFLIILAHGARVWSLEKALLKKKHEMF